MSAKKLSAMEATTNAIFAAGARDAEWNNRFVAELNKLGFQIIPVAPRLGQHLTPSPHPDGDQYPWPSYITEGTP